MDILADVLSVTRLGSAVLARAELAVPWGLLIGRMTETAVHVVQRGVCWLRVEGEASPRRVAEGDIMLISGGVSHELTDNPATPVRPYTEVLARMPERLRGLDEAQMLETTTILCAKYLFDHKGPHPLTRILPPLILLRGPEVDRQPQLRLLIQLLRMEAGESANGSALVVPRLLDSLLVFLLRAWMDSQPQGVGGWFCALRDPGIRRALSLIHEQPHAEWTVDSLAAGAAQSRATFARRFAHLVGETPGAYLTRWRMCLAAKLLREGDRPLEDIAAAVGYSSAPAFSRVFQR